MHTNIKHIFNINDLNLEFDKNGFVLLKNHSKLNISSLSKKYFELHELYINNQTSNDSSYDLSFFTLNPQIKEKIFSEIWDNLKEFIETILPDYEPLIINMFNKKPGGGEVPIHQNWTFVDESKFTSVSVWIPLTKVNHKNGTLEVVKGTHKEISLHRSPTIPWVFKGFEEELKKEWMTPLNIEIGDIAIIDDSIIHYSSNNNSDKDRPSLQLILKPKKADAIHYLGDNGQTKDLKVFKVNSNYFFDFDMNSTEINMPLLYETKSKNEPFSINKLTLL
jgi:hypothetical protein